MRTRERARQSASTAPCTVFDTPELLEAILSCLDMRPLLTCAQRVSRRWHATVAGSPVLQRHLYLHARPQQDRSGPKTCNPLLADAFPAWFPSPPAMKRGFGREAFSELPMYKPTSRQQAFLRPQASWRRMLVTQPPSETLGCCMSEDFSGCMPDDSTWRFKILEFPQGLRMGKLYDLSQRWVGTTSHTRFAVFWTPGDYSTLNNFYFCKSFDNACEIALRKCGAAVDVILRGDRWDAPSTWSKRKDEQFRKKFAYIDNGQAQELEPARDSGYKTYRQWATELGSP